MSLTLSKLFRLLLIVSSVHSLNKTRICYDTAFTELSNSTLKTPDKQIRYVIRDGHCRTHCAGNATCAAYSYNSHTSTCYLSSQPYVDRNMLASAALFVKISFMKHYKESVTPAPCTQSSTVNRPTTTGSLPTVSLASTTNSGITSTALYTDALTTYKDATTMYGDATTMYKDTTTMYKDATTMYKDTTIKYEDTTTAYKDAKTSKTTSVVPTATAFTTTTTAPISEVCTGMQDELGNCYFLITAQGSWASVREHCSRQHPGADLVDVYDIAKREALARLMTSEGLERVQYWIGASQTAIGTYFFQWTDGSTYIPAELWAAGQPSGVSLYPTWELCIKIRVVDGSLFLYDDYCAKTLSSICQIPSA